MFEASSSSRDGIGAGRAQTLRRIMREHDEIRQTQSCYWTARPLNEEDPFEWHFALRGPEGTPFEGGIYHGKILLPQNYPLGPPHFIFLNQNGRFEVGKKACLSASRYHPELWQPAWGLRTMLDALHVFFATPAEGALHGLNWSPEVRRKLAIESVQWACPVCKKSNAELIAEFCLPLKPQQQPSLPWPLLSETGLLPSKKDSDPTAVHPECETSVSSSAAAAEKPLTSLTSRPGTVPQDDGRIAENVAPAVGVDEPSPVDPEQSPSEMRADGDRSTFPCASPPRDAAVETDRATPPPPPSDRAASSRQGLTVQVLLQIFVLLPLWRLVEPFVTERVPYRKRFLHCLDLTVMCVLLLTVCLLFDVIRRPSGVIDAFFLDHIA